MRSVAAIRNQWERHRELIGRFVFELVIVFIGVTAAFALENWRERASEAQYHAAMIAALRPTLDDVIRHNAKFDAEVLPRLAAFDAAIAAGGQPPLPIYREPLSERPPTRAWDGLVASGAARALNPDLFFELALFYTRQESFGERYVRYNDFTEQHVFTVGQDTAAFYDPVSKRLKPEFAAYVDRLRDLQRFNDAIASQAKVLRDKLAKGS
ncbi:MAG TPA: hypothetical protein VFY97_00520 [Rhodanobacteraceae bacterium]|nr:hypothetical protein [Rhodanobacteraceae bacterium]